MSVTTLKARAKPLKVTGSKRTIDYLHCNKMKELKYQMDEEVPKWKRQVAYVDVKMDEVRAMLSAAAWDGRRFHVRQLEELSASRKQLHDKIQLHDGYNGYADYFYRVMAILDEYYEDGVCENEPDRSGLRTPVMGLVRSVTVKHSDRLYKRYLGALDVEHCPQEAEEMQCDNCKSFQLVRISFTMVCQDCGVEMSMLNVSPDLADRTFKELQDIDVSKKFQYQRINHFGEWIENSQGIQQSVVPDEVIDALRAEITKQRLSVHQITEKKVRDMLKKTKNNGFYKYRTYITDRLTGRDQLRFDTQTVGKLKQMFHEIQEPFERHLPKGRKSFLTYAYILHKFCELLSLDRFLIRYPYLKNRQRLKEYDQTWRNICRDVNYEYIPSL